MSWCEYCKDRSSFFFTNYKCIISGKETDIPDNYINNYCMYNYNVYNCPYYREYGPTKNGCFITTVACEILNKKDNDNIMNKLRLFRDNVLQKNEEYFDLLKEYDTIGPILAEKLRNDENKEKIAVNLYEVLENVSKLINEEKITEAVEKYYLMTLMLINYYDLKHYYNEVETINYENFDPSTAGHGKMPKKVLKPLDL